MNLTATAPACRRSWTPVQTKMMTTKQFTTAVVDANLIFPQQGRPGPALPKNLEYLPRKQKKSKTLDWPLRSCGDRNTSTLRT